MKLRVLLLAVAGGTACNVRALDGGSASDGVCCLWPIPADCANPCSDPAPRDHFCAKSKTNCASCNATWCTAGPEAANIVKIDVSEPTFTVSDAFISATLDTVELGNAGTVGSHWQDYNFSDPVWQRVARSFAPMYLRVGGTAEDNQSWIGPTASFQRSSSAIPSSNITPELWASLCEAASTAGWQIVYGLNSFDGWSGGPTDFKWSSKNSEAFMKHSQRQGCPVSGWELGDEPDLENSRPSLAPAEDAEHFDALAEVVSAVFYAGGRQNASGNRVRPWIVGPDSSHRSIADGWMQNFLGNMTAPVVDILTYHQYFATAGEPVHPSDFTDPKMMDDFVSLAQAAQHVLEAHRSQRSTFWDMPPSELGQLWIGETANVGGDPWKPQEPWDPKNYHSVAGRFLGVFAFADKLGVAAAHHHSVVLRQQYHYAVRSLDGGGVQVTPLFWLLQTWKKVMGPHVFAVSDSTGRNVRVYAHGTEDTGGMDLTVAIINLGTDVVHVPIELEAANATSSHEVLQLTSYPNASDMSSMEAAMNGKHLQLGSDGSIKFEPRIVPGSTVDAAPHSITFATFKVTSTRPLPPPAPPAPPAPPSGDCTDGASCRLNGVCVAGTCQCDRGWTGSNCERLDLLPIKSTQPGDRSAKAGAIYPSGKNLDSMSSWGGGVFQLDGKWHLIVSEMGGNCGMASWQSNSQLRHATSDRMEGPYLATEPLVLGPYSHNAMPILHNGTVYVWHVGEGAPNLQYITNCTNGTTPCPNDVRGCPGYPPPPAPAHAPSRRSVGDTARKVEGIAMKSKGANGPWETAPITCTDGPNGPGSCPPSISNPSLYIFPNGA